MPIYGQTRVYEKDDAVIVPVLSDAYIPTYRKPLLI